MAMLQDIAASGRDRDTKTRKLFATPKITTEISQQVSKWSSKSQNFALKVLDFDHCSEKLKQVPLSQS